MPETTNNDPYAPYRSADPFDPHMVPEPVLDAHPTWIDLYYAAWESAWRHVVLRPDMPQPRYLDEALMPHRIWIWDTCFMALYARYAADAFPGIESLDNFYHILYGDRNGGATIHFSDNPPLFAWVEELCDDVVPNDARLRWILDDGAFLQRHFEYMEAGPEAIGTQQPHTLVARTAARHEAGYLWRGNTSGMDNTPRGRTACNDDAANPIGQIQESPGIYWLDLLAQQSLAAGSIAQLADRLGRDALADRFRQLQRAKNTLLGRYYWNEDDGIHYDILALAPEELDRRLAANEDIHCRVPTIASYWPLLAGACSSQQAASLAAKASDPVWFGGEIPYPTLARRDAEYRPGGRYWRGGVWLPTAYMATKALERHGYGALADANAERLIAMMVDTYHNCEPHTIWEAYAPSHPAPATHKNDHGTVRTDFCGWSALGPIALLIENVLGFRRVSGRERLLEWHIHRRDRHGIRALRFGDVQASLIHDEGHITVESNGDFTLRVLGRGVAQVEHAIAPGTTLITAPDTSRQETRS
ncbi:MAG: MGH1-like glycoside hydrolase domain-containing protein [Planctomycetota bacterium]